MSDALQKKTDEFRALVAESVADVFIDYLQDLRADGDLEDRQKFLTFAAKVIGAEAKKEDVKPTLPIFNINFSMGGAVQAEIVKPVEVVEEVLPELPAPVEADPLADLFASLNAQHAELQARSNGS